MQRLKTSWRNNQPSLYAPVTDWGVEVTLMQWGMLQFTVQTFNTHEYDHESATDWAQKEIAGAAIYREWVGENDETLLVRGRLFPYRLGGMARLEEFESQRRRGLANMLVRGTNPAEVLGWFVVERLVRSHTSLSSEGVGRMINFEAVFVRVPVPSGVEYMPQLWEAGALA